MQKDSIFLWLYDAGLTREKYCILSRTTCDSASTPHLPADPGTSVSIKEGCRLIFLDKAVLAIYITQRAKQARFISLIISHTSVILALVLNPVGENDVRDATKPASLNAGIIVFRGGGPLLIFDAISSDV